MKRNTFILFLLLLLFRLADLHSQTLAVKNDLLTGALSSPNLSVEVKLSDRFTLVSTIILSRRVETSVGNTGSYSRNCATGCASPSADTSSART